MSIKSKIEAVIYAAEEPVTLGQLAGIFAQELPPAETPTEEKPATESLVAEPLIAAESLANGSVQAETVSAAAEAEAKRAARLRERQVREQIEAIVDELIEEYSTSDRGMEIREVAGGYRIATKPEYHDAVRAFVKNLKPPMKLSLQALETLAVIAYKQPVTAPEVAEIRGVDSSGVLGSLMGRKLITTAGRKQVIGRPILYKTTREFLLRFGLKDVNELPSIEEFEKLAGDIEIGEDDPAPVGEANLPFAKDNSTESLSTDVGASSVTTAPSSARVGGADSPAEDSPEKDQPSGASQLVEEHHG